METQIALSGRSETQSEQKTLVVLFGLVRGLRKETLIATMQRFVVHEEHEKTELLWLSLTAAVYL